MRIESGRLDEAIGQAERAIHSIDPLAEIDPRVVQVDQEIRLLTEEQTGRPEPVITESMKNDLYIQATARALFSSHTQ